jgi:hypothetical protein
MPEGFQAVIKAADLHTPDPYTSDLCCTGAIMADVATATQEGVNLSDTIRILVPIAFRLLCMAVRGPAEPPCPNGHTLPY